MALASKLLGIWLTERTVTSTTPLFMRLLGAIAAIAVLAAMASSLLALIMAGLLWMIYEQLLVHGLPQQIALLCMIGIVLIMLSVLVIFVQGYINRIRALSNRLVVGQAPVTGGLSSVVTAFVRGLSQSSPLYR